jgi:hypothetical protein
MRWCMGNKQGSTPLYDPAAPSSSCMQPCIHQSAHLVLSVGLSGPGRCSAVTTERLEGLPFVFLGSWANRGWLHRCIMPLHGSIDTHCSPQRTGGCASVRHAERLFCTTRTAQRVSKRATDWADEG